MYISRKWNIGAILGQKCGSTSVGRMFIESLDGERIAGHHEVTELALRRRFHMVTHIREHCDTMASWWSGDGLRSEPHMTVAWLEGFVGRCPWIRDHKLWWMYSTYADEIVRFERMQEDWERVFRARGIPLDLLTLENVNPSPFRQGRSWRDIVSPEAEAWIRAHFWDERLRWGYEGLP